MFNSEEENQRFSQAEEYVDGNRFDEIGNKKNDADGGVDVEIDEGKEDKLTGNT